MNSDTNALVILNGVALNDHVIKNDIRIIVNVDATCTVTNNNDGTWTVTPADSET
jgi:hypothetical protein